MRKYKQIKEKKVIYSLDEWAVIEQRAAELAMKTGTYIRRISVDGQIKHYSVGDITTVMNALRIIGKNINQIAAKANENQMQFIKEPCNTSGGIFRAYGQALAHSGGTASFGNLQGNPRAEKY